jgi:hypothetical protein
LHQLAREIRDASHVETLEALEIAAHEWRVRTSAAARATGW